MVLHFRHAVSNHKGRGWSKVHAFAFGTRQANITRQLGQRDVDAGLQALADALTRPDDSGEKNRMMRLLCEKMI